MTDIENEVFTRIADALRAEFKGISVSSSYDRKPTEFPFVSLEEADSYTESDLVDSAAAERFEHVMYEANVYSNKSSGRKSEAKEIMDAVCGLMHQMNFIRTSRAPVPNMEDATIYRITARFEAVTDGNTIFRR